MDAPKEQRWKRRTYAGNQINANGVAMLAKGTSCKPHPLNKACIVGDPQRDGKPNPEVVIAIEKGPDKGVHVMPIKDLKNYGHGTKCYNEGTGTLKKRTPRVDGRVIQTRPAPNPAAKVDRGLDAHNRTSLIKTLDKMRDSKIKKYAYGTMGPYNSNRIANPNTLGRLPRPTMFRPRVTDARTGQVQEARNFLPSDAAPVPVRPVGDAGDGLDRPVHVSTGMSRGSMLPRRRYGVHLGSSIS